MGIPEPYALVEMEVNNGLGSPQADAFVASNVRVLDGTKLYPVRVAPTVRRLQVEYDKYLKGQQDAVSQVIENLAEEALAGRPMTGPRETKQQLFITWLTASEQLRVEFRTRITDGYFRYGKGTEPSTGDTDHGTNRMPKTGARFGTEIGVELGMIYLLSKAGQVDREEPIPLRTIQREISPPRKAR